jgi:5-methylcytosine-specific restriction endonuclease McrA
MTVTRGTTNRNERGTASTRRALKCWMLGVFGDGITAPCAFCGRQLLYSQMTKDRFPLAGRKGGKYRRGNVRPACMSCNASEGARQAALERTERKVRLERRNALRRARYAEKRAQSLAEGSGAVGAHEHPTAA